MEDMLDLYAEAPDPKRPVVCFASRSSSSAKYASRFPPPPGRSSAGAVPAQRHRQPYVVFVDVNRPAQGEGH
jgi:hypothetical protein